MAAIKIKDMITGKYHSLPVIKGDPGLQLPDGFDPIKKSYEQLTEGEKNYLLKIVFEVLGLIEN